MAEELAFRRKRKEPEARHYFSPAEANRAVPLIRRVVDDLMKVFHKVMALRGAGASDPYHEDAGEVRDYDAGMQRLSELLEELQTVGVELRDFDRGVVAFPGMHQGREILLLWQHGDEQVASWQEVGDGLDARKPLDSLEEHTGQPPPMPD